MIPRNIYARKLKAYYINEVVSIDDDESSFVMTGFTIRDDEVVIYSFNNTWSVHPETYIRVGI